MPSTYFDVWKKKMNNNGGSVTQSRLNDSYNFINNNFKDDPSYKLAILRKKDNTIVDSDLDTRIVNIDTDPFKKKIYLRPETKIDIGDYIVYSDDTYLALAVENNLVSPRVDCECCNHILKYMVNGQLYSMPSIVINNPRFTLGLKTEVAGITEENEIFRVKVPWNSLTKKIQIGQRFIINKLAWKVVQLDFTSSQGLLTILLGQSSINYETDDTENEIANGKHDYSITLNSTSQTLEETGVYKIVAEITDNTKVVDNVTVIYTSSDEAIATVDSAGKVTAIKAGSTNITATIGNVNTILTLTVTAKTSSNVISYEHDFSQTTTIKQYVTSILTCTKTVDSISSPLNISYSIDSVGQSLISSGKLTITTKNFSSIAIKNVGIVTNTVIYLIVTDSDLGTKILDNIPITLTKGI